MVEDVTFRSRGFKSGHGRFNIRKSLTNNFSLGSLIQLVLMLDRFFYRKEYSAWSLQVCGEKDADKRQL